MNLLLALGDKPEIDVSAHLEIATNLALTGLVLMIAFFAVRYDLWRRLWFDRVDPRPAACMRIFFGLVIVITFTDLLKPSGPLEISVARFLFTDDGLWLTDMARKNYGGDLKELWDPEHGVKGVGSWFAILYNKFCIFHMRSDPPFVFLLYGMMLASLVGMIVGWKTRAMTIIAWILVENFYRYSPIFYTGGDTVVRVFLFLGMFSRWGEAYSLDSWRRRRRAILGVSKVVACAAQDPGVADAPHGAAAVHHLLRDWDPQERQHVGERHSALLRAEPRPLLPVSAAAPRDPVSLAWRAAVHVAVRTLVGGALPARRDRHGAQRL